MVLNILVEEFTFAAILRVLLVLDEILEFKTMLFAYGGPLHHRESTIPPDRLSLIGLRHFPFLLVLREANKDEISFLTNLDLDLILRKALRP